MSDIQEEQKRLYKRAEQNDYIVKDIAQYEETDSNLAKHTIMELQEENKNLKEKLINITSMIVCGDGKQIKNTAQYKLDIAQDRINKAIEYINNGTMISNIENLDFKFNSNFKPEELLDILKGNEEK